MKRNILVFGLLSGALVSTFMGISMYFMSCNAEHPSGNGGMIMGFTAMIAAFSFIFVGIKNFRDKQNGGTITFGKALSIGLMISLIASTMYVATWAVEFHYFMPDFIDKYSAMQVKELQAGGLSADDLAKKVAEIEAQTYSYKHNPFVFAAFTYMEILPVGILITLISALILKRKNPRTV